MALKANEISKAATNARNRSSLQAVAEGRPSKQEAKPEKEKPYAFNVKMPANYEFLIKEAILNTQKETGKRVSMNQFIVDAIAAKLGIS